MFTKIGKMLKEEVLGILITNDIYFKLRGDLSTSVEGEFETIFIEATSKEKQAIPGGIYRIPHKSGNVIK